MNSAPSNTQRLRNAKALSASQTLLWFSAGVAGMFLIVSAIFAIKLSLQDKLPFTTASRAAPAPEEKPTPTALTPPIQSAATGPGASAGSSAFESGTEGILPPEAAHLAKVTIATAGPTPAAPATPAVATADTGKAIDKQVRDWAAAWQGKAIDDYLKHYAPDFQPAGNLTRADWLAQRQQRLSRPGTISVEISKLEIQHDGDTASARFQQTYRADGQPLIDRKTLELVRRDGQWLIRREYTGG